MSRLNAHWRAPILAVSAFALASAAPAQEQPPGAGILCMGTLIYYTERIGTSCHAGEDAEFQARIAGYARRFDTYIVRNTGGDSALLAQFKRSQHLDGADQINFCTGEVAEL